jgi:hypothetical protein
MSESRQRFCGIRDRAMLLYKPELRLQQIQQLPVLIHPSMALASAGARAGAVRKASAWLCFS